MKALVATHVEMALGAISDAMALVQWLETADDTLTAAAYEHLVDAKSVLIIQYPEVSK